MEKTYKKYWRLIIGSIAVFFISVVLHNFLYAAHILTADVPVLGFLTEALHAIFFLISIPICPIALFAGIIGLVITFMRERDGKNE